MSEKPIIVPFQGRHLGMNREEAQALQEALLAKLAAPEETVPHEIVERLAGSFTKEYLRRSDLVTLLQAIKSEETSTNVTSQATKLFGGLLRFGRDNPSLLTGRCTKCSGSIYKSCDASTNRAYNVHFADNYVQFIELETSSIKVINSHQFRVNTSHVGLSIKKDLDRLQVIL